MQVQPNARKVKSNQAIRQSFIHKVFQFKIFQTIAGTGALKLADVLLNLIFTYYYPIPIQDLWARLSDCVCLVKVATFPVLEPGIRNPYP
jgi:hypothetical protein